MDGTTSIERASRRLTRASRPTHVHQRFNAVAGVTFDRPAYSTIVCPADEGPRVVTGKLESSGVDVSKVSRPVDRARDSVVDMMEAIAVSSLPPPTPLASEPAMISRTAPA